MNGVEVISVHVPKCAGASLFRIFQAAYGSEHIYRDYVDRPVDPTSPMNLDREAFFQRAATAGFGFLDGKRIVHGHFNIRKYEGVRARLRVTFLRDPVERTISHYYFWQTLPRSGHVLHDYVLDHRLSLADFARLPLIRDFYSLVFFGGVAMEQFDFIGFHNRLEHDFVALLTLLGLDRRPLPIENANSSAAYRSERERVSQDHALLHSLRDALSGDIAFYDKIREKWA
jgi:hypothetical protein